ncbi:MAG: head-tail connector protein [Rickettsiales bacterium]|jgi:hypothetical protein|nr:head-tail connector protein [Rickettsiales bacterium]
MPKVPMMTDISSQINVTELIKNWERVKRDRSPWETKWNEIHSYVFPDHECYSKPSGSRKESDYSSPELKNYTSVVVGKVNKIVAQLYNLLIDPSTDWMSLQLNSLSVGPAVLRLPNWMTVNISKSKSAKEWCTLCKLELYKLFQDPSSNFYSSTYSMYFDWFSLGTGCREILLRGDNSKIQFNAVSMADIFVETSGYGDIKNIYRRYNLTPRQAHDIWGDNLHPGDLQKLTNEFAVTKEYIDICTPNPYLGMPGQIYPYLVITIDPGNRYLIGYGYHFKPPYAIARFFVKSGEVYGHSVLWDGIPDISTINKLAKIYLKGEAYRESPALLVKDANSFMAKKIRPSAIVQGLDSQLRPQIVPLNMTANPRSSMELYSFKLNDIDETLLFKDIFPPQSPTMTATEVNERVMQMYNRVKPTLIGLQGEDLNNTVLRTLSLMDFLGILPPFPYDDVASEIGVDGIDTSTLMMLLPKPIMQLNISFGGKIAKMQNLSDVRNDEIFLQKVVMAAQVDPSVLDRINLDQLLAAEAEAYDLDPKIIRSDKEVAAIREERAKTMRQREQLELQQTALKNQNQTLENQVLEGN